MISPSYYKEEIQNLSYPEMMKKRDELIASIHAFEKAGKKGDRSGAEWQYFPSPEVVYQMDLEYLAQLLQVMHQKYNEEYVWGERTLCEDYMTQD